MSPCRWCITSILQKSFNHHRPAAVRRISLIRSFGVSVETTSYRPKSQHESLSAALDRTIAILPKVFPPSNVLAWSGLLEKSSKILSGVASQKPRIAVISLDRYSRPNEVVSALLDNPLISDQNIVKALRNHELHGESFVLSYGQFHQSRSTLTLDVPFLRSWDCEIIEISREHPDAIPLLYAADIQLLVVTSNTSTLLPIFYPLLRKPGAFVIFRYPTLDKLAVDHTVSSLSGDNLAISEAIKAKLVHLHPPKALSAVDLFRKDSTSSYVVQSFQDDYIGSGVPNLSDSISTILSTDSQTLKVNYAECVLEGALHACRDTLGLVTNDIAAIQSSVNDMRSQILEIHSSTNDMGLKERVAESLNRSTKLMQPVMNEITWWTLPFMVDDLHHHITSAVDRVWCRDLQGVLQFQSGRMSLFQSQVTSNTFSMISNSPPSFKSALLSNELQQIACQPPPIGPATLTYPISYRQQQLQEPTIKLHRHAQQSMILLSFMTLGSWSSVFAAWLFDVIAPSTTIGLGCLGSVLALRWFVGKWDKIKRRWWQDWTRTGEGLGADLQETLSLIMREKVTAVPMKAIDELEKMAHGKMDVVTAIQTDLDNIRDGWRDQSVLPNQPGIKAHLQQNKSP